MSSPKKKTQPDFSLSSALHQEALANGTEHFSSWQYNVQDHFKGLTTEQIRFSLQATAHPFAVCMENFIYDFNQATLIRNANAFNAREVFYVGAKKYDRRASQGTHHYIDVTWLSTLDEILALKEKYVFVGIDNINGSVPLTSYVWPSQDKEPLIILGSEGTGLTPTMISLCDDIVHIPQYGSVRSINCGCASAIVMNDFVTKYYEIHR